MCSKINTSTQKITICLKFSIKQHTSGFTKTKQVDMTLISCRAAQACNWLYNNSV